MTVCVELGHDLSCFVSGLGACFFSLLLLLLSHSLAPFNLCAGEQDFYNLTVIISPGRIVKWLNGR